MEQQQRSTQPQSTDNQHNLHRGNEGATTRAVENETSKIPSIGFLGLAVASMALSAGLVAADRKELGNFVGHWAPSLLIIGLYNKLVKIEKELAAARSV